MEVMLLLVTWLLPLVVIGAVVYLAVRLAVRHEHPNEPDR